MSSSVKMEGRDGGAVKGDVTVKTEGQSPKMKAESGDTDASASSTSGARNVHASTANGRAKREASPPPPTTYRDIPLFSSTLDDWRYHLMRLASHAKVDPSDPQQFPFPVKLNRKWPPKPKDPLPRAGDPVIDQFGKPVMVPAQRRDPSQPKQPLTAAERKRIPLLWPGPDEEVDEVEELISRLDVPKGPQADASLIGPSAGSNNATRAKAGLFQKRVREIHKASAAARRTHNEEALPWILEDYETSKEWESRRKESRRGMKALQQGIKIRREGGQFPTLPREDDSSSSASATVKSESTDTNVGEDAKPNVSSSNENHAPWIGKLEGEAHESGSTSVGGAMSHALFVFDERGAGGFRVVPVSRMYKFLQRPKHASKMTWEEAEKAFEMHQKARMGESSKWTAGREASLGGGSGGRYVSSGRTPGGGGDNGSVKSEYGSGPGSAIYRHLLLPSSSSGGLAGFSSQPSISTIYNRDSSQRRNQFVAVSGESKRGIRVKDEEGAFGEIDYEEDFADDEERNEGDDFAMGEEETRELEQRIKREMARAEEEQSDEEDDDAFDDLFNDKKPRKQPGHGENDVLTGSGKQMKKIMRALARREGTDLYDEDDEDRNPYLSDESDEGEESVMANPDEALRRVREEREREAREAAKNNANQANTSANASATVANGAGTAQQSKAPSKDVSRSGTPVPTQRPSGSARPQGAASTHRPGSGHANVAQRATSPSAHASRPASRSGSPNRDVGTPSSSLKRKSDMYGPGKGGSTADGGKRLRTATSGSGSQPGSPGTASPRSASPSRATYSSGSRPSGGSGAATAQPLSDLEREMVELVRSGKASTTKELIAHFAARLTKKSVKETFSKAATRLLITKKPEGTLSVRAGY